MPNEIEQSPADYHAPHIAAVSDDNIEQISCGDLYVLGKLWVDLLKIGLLGTQWNLLPKVEAAKPPPPPQKPPPMRYKDLPLYTTPHFDYKDHLAKEETKCLAEAKTINDLVVPYVTHCRQTVTHSLRDACTQFCAFEKNVKMSILDGKSQLKKYMRDPQNLVARQICLGLGGVVGYYIGSGTPNIPKKMFFTGCGLLAAGALCFPKETDETFRDVSYKSTKVLLEFYNRFCSKNFSLQERLPCKDEMPGPPPKRKANVCPAKKK